MDPIKYVFEKPALSGRIAIWKMILTEYDIQYTTQKAIKGSVLADHLVQQAVDDYQSMSFEFPDEDVMLVIDYEQPSPNEGPEQGSRWTMVFYGSSNALGNGIGVVIISLAGGHTPFIASLCFDCTNNMAEYEACILGLRASIDLRIKFLEVYEDSALVIWDNEAPIVIIEKHDESAYCYEIATDEVEQKPWFHEVKRYLEAQEYHEGASINDKKFLRRFASKFFLSNGTLYKCNHD
ncbi:uncharacterized protein LOC131659517 [Vicia villosa]|uniref:uncharacterized protein LOC131659517 n=1 Tax=Vicia villosa TaxID=3911 RepID=UPI00273AE1B2|nr:uncharacterized protein LOC131659517 [Vicia villosa]